jgi:uncharacterized membrane protein YgcG
LTTFSLVAVLVFAIPAVLVALLAYRFRAVRIIAVISVWIWIALLPVFQAVVSTPPSRLTGSSDTSVIDHYDLKYDLSADGTLTSVETLDVRFTETKHGIYRFFDEIDSVDPSVRHRVTIEKIERCSGETQCSPEPYTTDHQSGYLVAKIGSASVTYPPGTVNHYRISSSATGAITTVPGSTQVQWYWDVIGAGWQMPIRSATVTAQLPARPVGQVRCTTDAGPCTPQSGPDRTLKLNAGALPPQSPMTWQVRFLPVGLDATQVTPPQPEAPPPPGPLDSAAVKVGLVVLGCILAGLLFWQIRKRRDRAVTTSPAFAAPGPDLLPLTWTYRERPVDNAFQALLLHLSATGYLQVNIDPNGMYTGVRPAWIHVARTNTPVPDIAGAATLLDRLGLQAPGSQMWIESKSVEMGRVVKGLQAGLKTEATQAARTSGLAAPSSSGRAIAMVAAALPSVAFLVLVAVHSQALTALFAIPAVAGLWAGRDLTTTLTPAGLQARNAVAGLRTALSTPASVERYDYALKVRYFLQFLPWAVALGCADAWAEACKPDVAQLPDSPEFRSAMAMYYGAQAVSNGITSVSAGAVSAYSATQVSSGGGGGGGGFSSGGGSGGGGGGSW